MSNQQKATGSLIVNTADHPSTSTSSRIYKKVNLFVANAMEEYQTIQDEWATGSKSTKTGKFQAIGSIT